MSDAGVLLVEVKTLDASSGYELYRATAIYVAALGSTRLSPGLP